jgi:hypothetical protein
MARGAAPTAAGQPGNARYSIRGGMLCRAHSVPNKVVPRKGMRPFRPCDERGSAFAADANAAREIRVRVEPALGSPRSNLERLTGATGGGVDERMESNMPCPGAHPPPVGKEGMTMDDVEVEVPGVSIVMTLRDQERMSQP